jgi:acrylyl-CoA reductase (NADPH)
MLVRINLLGICCGEMPFIKGRDMFRAILVNKDEQGYRAELCQVDEASLPEGEVRVRVLYST